MQGQSFPQMMVNQTPRFDNAMKKKKRRENQVIGKGGLIRPDKRKKAHFI